MMLSRQHINEIRAEIDVTESELAWGAAIARSLLERHCILGGPFNKPGLPTLQDTFESTPDKSMMAVWE